MHEWSKNRQQTIELIDCYIKDGSDEKLTLSALSNKLGCSK